MEAVRPYRLHAWPGYAACSRKQSPEPDDLSISEVRGQTIIDTAGTGRLVIMATHGRSAVTRWTLGSVADRVARGGVAGVLLVQAAAVPAQEGASNG